MRWFAAEVKLHAAKHPRILEHERVLRGHEHKMIMFFRRVVRGLHEQFAAHTEVNPEPRITAETKRHLLRPRGGNFESRSGEGTVQRGKVDATEDFLGVVRQDADDAFASGRLRPAFAEKINLGEFGHGGRNFTPRKRRTQRTISLARAVLCVKLFR